MFLQAESLPRLRPKRLCIFSRRSITVYRPAFTSLRFDAVTIPPDSKLIPGLGRPGDSEVNADQLPLGGLAPAKVGRMPSVH